MQITGRHMAPGSHAIWAGLAALFLRPASVIRAENLVLRKQLAAYIERGIKPQRLDHAGRVSRAVLSRLFSWRDAIVVVRASTVIRWHRLGWRILWRWESRRVDHRFRQNYGA